MFGDKILFGFLLLLLYIFLFSNSISDFSFLSDRNVIKSTNKLLISDKGMELSNSWIILTSGSIPSSKHLEFNVYGTLSKQDLNVGLLALYRFGSTIDICFFNYIR